ncbi:MAG: ferrochelatase [Gammaproteobacteria bacterium]|nr:ferrochelatase [Gammaproteobacteria bacterium]NNC77290.1 ferrochelatase [Woeseiaceae bacterium]
MGRFQSSLPHDHSRTEALGVLLVNLGTPEAPTASAVRRYLAEFLWDPRVVEIPRPIWWLILHGFILRFRPARSAKAYAKIWTDDGSPLLLYSAELTDSIGHQLRSRLTGRTKTVLGMSYGSPSIPEALDELHAAGVRRIVVLPLYPQYSGTTTGSVFDAVTSALQQRRWVPELRFINHYHDNDAYIDALAADIRRFWEASGRGEKLIFSFHGVPRQTLKDGDPYHCHCQKTARLVAESLQLTDDDWMLTFQSRVGRAEWLRPYTDETIATLGANQLGRIDVVCPGFAVDCLETLEEIAMQNAELFVQSGGGELKYIPALNAGAEHVELLSRLIESQIAGWPEASGLQIEDDNAQAAASSQQRAIAMGAAQ